MRVRGLVVAVIVTGCGGGGDGGGGTPPPPAVASVAITPNSAQSTTLCGTVALSAQARDAQGGALSRTISWSASPANVEVSPTSGPSTTATGVAVGSSTVTATADGVTSTVAVNVAAGGQGSAAAEVAATTSNTFTPGCVNLAAGGTVTWTFGSVTHNVVFGSNKPTGGDIDPKTSTTDQRTFPTVGNYPYQCTLHPGMSGRVIVQ